MRDNILTVSAIIIGIVAVVIIVFAARKFKSRLPRHLDSEKYEQRLKEIYVLLRDKKTWPLAVIEADKLLDEALRTRRFKGKTMGERLVSAQHEIKNNNDVWFAHKLRNKLVHERDIKLRQRDVKDALLGIRAALRDLGAL